MAVSKLLHASGTLLTVINSWLFIINSIITVVWGMSGIFLLPDLPNKPNPRAVWFKAEDASIAMARLSRHGREEPKRVSWKGAK